VLLLCGAAVTKTHGAERIALLELLESIELLSCY
jgi:hypothetical protein